jgi:hypothetical protein
MKARSHTGRQPARASSLANVAAPSISPITLPSDLSRALQYLDDAQLRRLHEAVEAEINRRALPPAVRPNVVPVSERSSGARRSTRGKQVGSGEIPEGKVNLIQASFAAGLKPAAIARTLRISQAQIRQVLHSSERLKRKLVATGSPRYAG